MTTLAEITLTQEGKDKATKICREFLSDIVVQMIFNSKFSKENKVEALRKYAILNNYITDVSMHNTLLIELSKDIFTEEKMYVEFSIMTISENNDVTYSNVVTVKVINPNDNKKLIRFDNVKLEI